MHGNKAKIKNPNRQAIRKKCLDWRVNSKMELVCKAKKTGVARPSYRLYSIMSQLKSNGVIVDI